MVQVSYGLSGALTLQLQGVYRISTTLQK